jgi:hypothetical protein
VTTEQSNCVDPEAEPVPTLAGSEAAHAVDAIVRGMILGGMMLLLFCLLATMIIFFFSPAAQAQAEEVTGAVCPPGNVKLEADGGTAYTDESATVELSNANLTATWTPAPGRTVIAVCIKIGGPGGGALINPDPAAGAWTSEQYAISHVVLTTGGPNSVEITDITAARTVAGIQTDPPADYRALVLLLVVLGALLIGIETLGALRRRRWGK